MFEYSRCLITLKIWQFLSFGEFFSSWKRGWYVVKLVAAKVIRQHMFFFWQNLFLIISFLTIFEIKERYDSFSPWKSWTSPTFLQGFWPGKSCKLFIYQKFT